MIAFFLPVGTTTPLNNIILAVGWVLIIAGLVVFIVMPLRWTRRWWRVAGCLLIEVAAFLLIMLITGMILGARAGMFG